MLETWRQEYQKLTEFISAHPEIVITPDSVTTPEMSREDFYSLFTKVGETLADELCSAIIAESSTISGAYNKAFAEAIAGHYIETILTPLEFDRFVQDPRATLAISVFDPLWAFLKGKIKNEAFELMAKNAIESKARDLQSVVYEKCIILFLVNLYRPDEVYECEPKEPGLERMSVYRGLGRGALLVPLPKRTHGLSWKRDDAPMLTLPDFIMRSSVKEKDRFIAIRSGFRPPTNPADNPNREHEWLSVEPKFTIDSDVILVYEDDNPLSIALVAETGRFCKPDSFIKYRTNKSENMNQWLDSAKINSNTLQPRLGFHLISRVP